MAKTIYIVTSGSYSDYCINRVFSTRKLAEYYVGGKGDDHAEGYGVPRIEEYEIDEPITERYMNVWRASATRQGGELVVGEGVWDGMQWKGVNWRGGAEILPHGGQGTALSPVSADHAKKLLAEAIQAHKRKAVYG